MTVDFPFPPNIERTSFLQFVSFQNTQINGANGVAGLKITPHPRNHQDRLMLN